MGGDQAFNALAAVGIGGDGAAGEHVFEDMEKLFGDLKIALIAGMVKRDKDFIRQAPAVARCCPALFYTLDAGFFSFTHA